MTKFYFFKVWLNTLQLSINKALLIGAYLRLFFLRCCLLVTFIATLSIHSSAQTKYHVKADGGDDSNDGLSWNNAYATLQKAIETTVEGDSIWVAKGIYTPTKDKVGSETSSENRDKTFYINKNIKIYGSFAGTEISLPERMLGQDTTFLDGILPTMDSAYHVVYIDGTSSPITADMILDGFAIRHGRANGSSSPDAIYGGAIYNNGFGGESSPSIINATFYNNSAVYQGGAIFNNGKGGESSPSIINATFYNNSASHGGAIYNEGENGASSPSLINAMFYNNSASRPGGAIFNNGYAGASSPSLINAMFYNNSASHGGAIYNEGIEGGISSPSLVNVTFYNNSAIVGGAIYSGGEMGESSPSLVNVTFYNNSADYGGGAIYNVSATPTIQNSIFWNNKQKDTINIVGADISDRLESNTTISYSITQENSAFSSEMDGIINNQDPKFVDAENGDFRLLDCSPALDAGTDTGAPDTDIVGNTRPQGDGIDMGAYEGDFGACPVKYHVNAANGNDTNTGLSWNNAFATLQKAIETTAEGDSIWVAKGVYIPSVAFDGDKNGTAVEREKTFYLNKNIKIYGSFAGTEMILSERMLGQDTTFLDGAIPTTTDSVYHVVYIDGTANDITSNMILDGFTIRHGRADGDGLNNSGGAIYNNGFGGESSPSIVNATFYNNLAREAGGAIFNYGRNGTSSPSIVNSTFYNNSAISYGGAIFNDGKNGESSPNIVNATFYNNWVDEYGGAIYNLGQSGISSPRIINATFYNNSARRGGGAIINDGGEGTSSPNIVNATFYNNSTDNDGGAILNLYATPIIKNNIFWNNKKNNATGIAGADIENIFSTTTISYSLTQENSIHFTGNEIVNNQDPQFVAAENGDFRLLAGSPALDVGDDTAIPMDITTDLGGNVRIQDGRVDLGAFEGEVALPKKYHVNASGGNDTNDGLTWNNAFATLQKAIETTVEGDSIWVAKGVYIPSVAFDGDGSGTAEEREKTFYLNKNIKIYGSFVGTEIMLSERMLGQNTTFLDGALSATDSAYHVLYIDGKSNPITNELILNGFTIRHGRAGADGSYPNITGGAILNDGRSGGRSNPSIVNVTFYNNWADEYGGAISNSGQSGISSPRIINAIFYNNWARRGGGAIMNHGGEGTSSPNIVNATFYNNSTGSFGYGGAILNFYATPIIKNSIFWNNKKNNAIDVANADIVTDEYGFSSTSISYSLTQENSDFSSEMDSIINNQDPQFVDAENGDFRLLVGSPALDVGDDTAIPMDITTDLGGNVRIQDGRVDLGAFEGGVILPKKYHVNADGGDDTNDGLTWDNAFATLQKGIETTAEGDSIWVAKGIYTPTANRPETTENRQKTFYINKNIKIYGSFAGTEMTLSERMLGQDTTFLDGILPTMDSTYHVVYIDGTSNPITNEMILDGFTIRHGRAGDFIENAGGAIFNNGVGGESSPSIVNATFYNNSADNSGGAIYNNGYQGISSPSLINVTFYNNSADSGGGAIYNTGQEGECRPSLINAIFYNNSAISGGAIYNGRSSPSLVNATFYNNSAANSGGAIVNEGIGGISSPNLVNVTFYNNSADFGGAIWNLFSTPTIQNCIFWDNKQNDTINIAGADILNTNASITISYSLTQEKSTHSSGMGILNNKDPQFVDAENGDFRLFACSPVLDAGIMTSAPDTDILGVSRPQGAGIDMGAYEFEGTPIQIIVNAGVDTAVCNPTYTLQGSTLQTGETGQWTFVNNLDDKGTLTNSTSATAIVNANFITEDIFEGNSNNPITVTLQWKVTSDNCPAGVSDTVVVTLNPPVSAGIDVLDKCGTSIRLGATPASGGTGNWTFITNSTPLGTLDDASKPNDTLRGVMGGSYELEWTITGGVCNGSMDRIKIAFQPDTDGDTVQDCVDICEGGDDKKTAGDNTGMPDDCDCAPFSAEGEFVMIASSDLDMNVSQNPLEMKADFQITSDAIVKAMPTHPATIFQAGNNIVLAAGFHAQAGSDFIARIGPCKEPGVLVEESPSNSARSKDIAPLPTTVFDLRVQPNLIHTEATVFLDLSVTQDLKLVLYDQTGRLVRTFLNTTQAAGSHQFLLRTDYLQSGMYYLQMLGENKVIVKRLVVQQ